MRRPRAKAVVRKKRPGTSARRWTRVAGLIEKAWSKIGAPRIEMRIPTLYDLVAWPAPEIRRHAIRAMTATALLLCGYLYVFSPTGLIARQEVREIIAAKHDEIRRLETAKLRLASELGALSGDTSVLEAIARNELNMVKPGETLYRAGTGDPLLAYRNARDVPIEPLR